MITIIYQNTTILSVWYDYESIAIQSCDYVAIFHYLSFHIYFIIALIKVWLKKQQNVLTSLMSQLNYEFLHFLLDTWVDIHGVPMMSVKGYVSICQKIKCLMNFFFFFFQGGFWRITGWAAYIRSKRRIRKQTLHGKSKQLVEVIHIFP